ncbi:MAG: HAD family hydrolase [Isosphaeraceae bacterium]
MPLPTLIFDFGNVIGFFDHMKVYEHFAPRLGMNGMQFAGLLLQRGFRDLLVEFECGRIGARVFAEQTMAMSGLLVPYEEFVAAWNDIFWLNESLAGLIPWFKSRGYTLVLGSNTNILHSQHYRRQFAATLDHFDRMIFSHDVGVMKPAAEFYRACALAAGVPAASCVFVDDVDENIKAARQAGMSGHVYSGTPQLIAALGRLGIEVPRE